MTVEQLIAELQQVEDKSLPVVLNIAPDRRGRGGGMASVRFADVKACHFGGPGGLEIEPVGDVGEGVPTIKALFLE